ncbi:hypothetical protein [Mesotoga sp. UBA6090]|uniref:hypothetical protein n=1 Tax=Mesotoga sp. UBA6090 TaxID=1946860 RepID=UPI0025EB642E|nr:hypothetical protein [Mesotoga sp. UBA6090]
MRHYIFMTGESVVGVEVHLETSSLKEAITDFNKYVKAVREATKHGYDGKKKLELLQENEGVFTVLRSKNVGRGKGTRRRLLLVRF